MLVLNGEGLEEGIRCALCTNHMKNDNGCDGGCVVDEDTYKKILKVIHDNEIKISTYQDVITTFFPTEGRRYDDIVCGSIQVNVGEKDFFIVKAPKRWLDAPYGSYEEKDDDPFDEEE